LDRLGDSLDQAMKVRPFKQIEKVLSDLCQALGERYGMGLS